jgi:hypothetical protein
MTAISQSHCRAAMSAAESAGRRIVGDIVRTYASVRRPSEEQFGLAKQELDDVTVSLQGDTNYGSTSVQGSLNQALLRTPGGGTLQEGECANWRSRKFFGLYYSSILVGVFQATTSLGPMIYAIFSNLIGEPSYQVNAAIQICSIWWSFKMFLGALSDCYPIYGMRRKPYIILGWFISILMLLAAIAVGQPYKNAPAWKWLLAFFGTRVLH